MKLDRDRLLSHLKGDTERRLGARAVDLSEQALASGKPCASDFLDPFEQQVISGVLGSIPEVTFRAYGGYPKAERKRLLIYPQYYLVELLEEPIAALEARVSGGGDGLSHRDYLGALLSCGIKREKVGDIIVTARGCQAAVALEVAPFLENAWTRVGNWTVSVEVIDPERLEVEPERVKEIKTTVASLRLDAVASSGFGTSRTRMVREIKAERVKLNWEPVKNPSQEVRAGDVISIRGRGRVVVEEELGSTRKGRTSLRLKRYM